MFEFKQKNYNFSINFSLLIFVFLRKLCRNKLEEISFIQSQRGKSKMRGIFFAVKEHS